MALSRGAYLAVPLLTMAPTHRRLLLQAFHGLDESPETRKFMDNTRGPGREKLAAQVSASRISASRISASRISASRLSASRLSASRIDASRLR